MGFNNISASLPGLFQSSFQNALVKSVTGADPMGGSVTASNILSGGGGAGFGGLVGGSGTLGGGVGTNPVNPLQGAAPLQGLNGFVGDLLAKNAARKAGLLPPTGAAAANPLTALLGSLMGAGGVPGAAPTAAGVPAASDPTGGLMTMILQLFSALQQMLGGGGAAAPQAQAAPAAAANPFAGGLGGAQTSAAGSAVLGAAPVAAAPQALAAAPQAAAPQAAGGLGGALGGVGNAIGGVFSRIGDGFARIDTAINQTLGSIFNTLPLVKL